MDGSVGVGIVSKILGMVFKKVQVRSYGCVGVGLVRHVRLRTIRDSEPGTGVSLQGGRGLWIAGVSACRWMGWDARPEIRETGRWYPESQELKEEEKS